MIPPSSSQLGLGRPPLPTAQLLHELPDGTHHIDWMIGRDGQGRQPLITFRLPSRLDQVAPGESLALERIADHRPAYLSYEGPISGGRGNVRTLIGGKILAVQPGSNEHGHEWILQIRWESPADDPSPRSLHLIHAGGDQWRIQCDPMG